MAKKNVDEECNCVGGWIYINLLLLHNFEMEYAMNLQQVLVPWIKIFNLAPSLNKLSVVWVIYRQRSLFFSSIK